MSNAEEYLSEWLEGEFPPEGESPQNVSRLTVENLTALSDALKPPPKAIPECETEGTPDVS